jgi:Fe-S cluster biosynthesis and repair protein YggX
MEKVKCLKCGLENQRIIASVYPGPLGKTIVDNICLTCWEAWKKFSVNVINENKLRPFLPADRAIVEQNMKQFLNLEIKNIKPLT